LVAQCIVDRLEDGRWGYTIYEVVTSPHQFARWRGCITRTRCYRNRPGLWQAIVETAAYALNGGRYTPYYRILHFRSRTSCNSDWWTPFLFRLGGHSFYGYRRYK
jgi:spore germination cell wall hydrolase CwlJ-like protein